MRFVFVLCREFICNNCGGPDLENWQGKVDIFPETHLSVFLERRIRLAFAEDAANILVRVVSVVSKKYEVTEHLKQFLSQLGISTVFPYKLDISTFKKPLNDFKLRNIKKLISCHNYQNLCKYFETLSK